VNVRELGEAEEQADFLMDDMQGFSEAMLLNAMESTDNSNGMQ